VGYSAYRRQRALVSWKYVMWDISCKLPTQLPGGTVPMRLRCADRHSWRRGTSIRSTWRVLSVFKPLWPNLHRPVAYLAGRSVLILLIASRERQMSNRLPNNGPSFSAPTYKNRPGLAPSPERKQVELEQAASDAAKQRRFRQMLRDDPEAWAKENLKKS
jgi:hypothetical protein